MDPPPTGPAGGLGGVAVEARGVTRRFGAVLANDDVSLAVRRGEVLAVLGENGAGKTTLLNVLSGMVRPDAGEVRVDGRAVALASPRDALRLGVGTVYQHFTLVPTLSARENALLVADGVVLLGHQRIEARLRAALGLLGADFPLDVEVRRLPVGQRQRLEIAKVLLRGPRVLLLDEPTSVLGPAETDDLLASLRRLADGGSAVVLVTHKLEEALRVSDRVAVMRGGRTVGELGPAELGADRQAVEAEVVRLMFGTVPVPSPDPTPAEGRRFGPVVLELDGLTVRGDRGQTALDGVGLAVRAGEIVGIAGVAGNGQAELAEAVAGQRPAAAGRVRVGGADITNRGVAGALRAGVAYVSDDRRGEGSVAGLSVADNLVLKRVGGPPFARRGLLDRGAIRTNARRLIGRFGIRAPGPETPAGALSGGNLQKVLLARDLALAPRVLVCKEPTAGLDLATARSVRSALRAHAAAGNAVLLISSDLDETLELGDRVGVLYRGRLVGPLDREAADRAVVGRLMLGGRAGADPAPVPA